jgi:hypothetical protein
MSHYWGYRCKTDGAESPHWLNHGQDILKSFIPMTPHFVAIKEMDTEGWIDEIKILGVSDWPNPPTFLVEHAGHDVAVIDEYGHWEDQEPPT